MSDNPKDVGESSHPELTPFHPLSLKFRDPLLENSFSVFYCKRASETRRSTGLLVLLFWALWTVFDVFFAPQENLTTLLAIRAAVFGLGLASYVTVFVDRSWVAKCSSLIWAILCMASACATSVMTTLNGKYTNGGTMTILLGTNVLLELPFYPYLSVAFLVPFFYAFILRNFGHASVALVLDNEFGIISAALLLAANSYLKEVQIRNEFRATQMMLDQWKLRADEAIELSKVSRLAAETKSRFLAVMSHEMRGPLHAIYSMAQLLTNSCLEDDDKESVQIILRSAELLLSLISDVLDVSRFDIQAIKLCAEQVNVVELIEDVVCLCESEVYKRDGLEIFASFQPDIPSDIFGDKNRLKQIILNLAWNAVKFCHQGYISIEVGVSLQGPPPVAPPHTAYAVQHPGSLGPCLSIAVRDTGVGIDVDDSQHLFKEFWQKDTSATRKFDGAGLGLSICKHLTGAMGGQLSVSNNPDNPGGACFTLFLPLSSLHCPAKTVNPAELQISIHSIDSSQMYCDLRDSAPAFIDRPIKESFSEMIQVPDLPITHSKPYAIFINQCAPSAWPLANYLSSQNFEILFFQNLEELRIRFSDALLPHLALVFVDSNSCGRKLPYLHPTMRRLQNANTETADSQMQNIFGALVSELPNQTPQLFTAPRPSLLPETTAWTPISCLDPTFSFPQQTANILPPAPFHPFVFFYLASTRDRAPLPDLREAGFTLQIMKPVKLASLERATRIGEEISASAARGESQEHIETAEYLDHADDDDFQELSSLPSKSRNGSISLNIPACESEPLPSPKPPSGILLRPAPQGPIRILVVDDNPINTRVMQKMLAGDKYSVATAADGLEAIARVDEFDYDCIFMDLHMPNMGGLEATMKIRSRSDAKKNVPIVALSADVLQETIEEAFKSGSSDFLPKPVKMEKLFSTIEKFVK